MFGGSSFGLASKANGLALKWEFLKTGLPYRNFIDVWRLQGHSKVLGLQEVLNFLTPIP